MEVFYLLENNDIPNTVRNRDSKNRQNCNVFVSFMGKYLNVLDKVFSGLRAVFTILYKL